MRERAVGAVAALQHRVAADREALADHPDGAAAADDLAGALGRLADALASPPHPDLAE